MNHWEEHAPASLVLNARRCRRSAEAHAGSDAKMRQRLANVEPGEGVAGAAEMFGRAHVPVNAEPPTDGGNLVKYPCRLQRGISAQREHEIGDRCGAAVLDIITVTLGELACCAVALVHHALPKTAS